MKHRKLISLNTSLASLAGLLAACASDNVDLGGNSSVEQHLEVGARCTESTIIEGDVFADSREALEALRGCETIRGDFSVMIFEGTDLSPLASLREVSSTFLLGAGAHPLPDEAFTNPDAFDVEALYAQQEAEIAASAAIVEAGWLESLHGLEGLERVGAMTLIGLAAPDLSAFANLRYLAGHPLPNAGGRLWIMQAKNLVDLHGLERVAGIQSLRADDNPSLQSLDGVRLNTQLSSVILGRNPSLKGLAALSSVDTLDNLAVTESGIENLDGIGNLTYCSSILLMGNPELRNIDAIGNLTASLQMSFISNPRLESIPPFRSLGSSLNAFSVDDNASLRSIALDLPFLTTTTALARPFNVEPPTEPRREVESGSGWYQISNNPRLERVSIAGNLTSALVVEFNHNSALSSIQLDSLRSINVLSIMGNPTLSEVGLRNIQSVNLLSVIDNPSLAVSELRSVRTFETVTSGNADDSSGE